MIDDSQCFARHVANARYEGQSPVAVAPVKTDLVDTLGLGIARSSFARAADLALLARSCSDARKAIVSADLANAGFRSAQAIFTGKCRCLVLFEDDNFDLKPFLETLGHSWRMMAMSHKPYPSDRLSHDAVDGLGLLIREHGFMAGDIAGVTARVRPLVHRLAGRPDVPKPVASDANLCLRYMAATFLARGNVDVADFRGEALTDAGVHRLAALIDVELDANPDKNALDPQTISVRLKSGAVHSVDLPHDYGHPDGPLSDAENEARFRGCLGYAAAPLPQHSADQMIAAIRDPGTMDDITSIVLLTLEAQR